MIEREIFRGKIVTKKEIVEGEGIKDLPRITGVAEQQFVLFIRNHRPNWTIRHEPDEFRVGFADGTSASTVPDNKLCINGKVIYVETTLAPLTESFDPKARQKAVMANFPEVLYRVLYKQHLDSIARHYNLPEFYHARKIRPEQNPGNWY